MTSNSTLHLNIGHYYQIIIKKRNALVHFQFYACQFLIVTTHYYFIIKSHISMITTLIINFGAIIKIKIKLRLCTFHNKYYFVVHR